MPNTIRKESRSRRLPGNVDTAVIHQHNLQRTGRIPSSSRIDLSLPQTFSTPAASALPPSAPSQSASTPVRFPTALLQSICHTLSYFALFHALYSNTTSRLLFVSFAACATTFFAFVVTNHRSLPAFQLYVHRPSVRQIIVLTSCLYIYSILGTAQSIIWLGPPRALIAFGAYPSFSRLLAVASGVSTRRSSPAHFFRLILAPFFLTLIAFLLLTHDATGRVIPISSANHVRQHVMHNPLARKVHTMVNNVLDRVPRSNQTNSLRSYTIPLRRRSRRKLRLLSNTSQYEDSNSRKPRRRILSIVKSSDGLNSTDSTDHNTNVTSPNPHESNGHTNNSQPERPLVYHNESRNDTLADEFPITENDSEPLPLLTAALAIFLAITAPLANRIASEFSHKIGVDDANPAPFLLLVFASCTGFSLALFIFHGLLTFYSQELLSPEMLFDAFCKGSLIGFLFFFMPIALRLNTFRKSVSSLRVLFPTFPSSILAMLNLTTATPSPLFLYTVALFVMFVIDRAGYSAASSDEELSFFSISSAFLLAIVAREETAYSQGRPWRDQARRSSQTFEFPMFFSKKMALYFRQSGKRFREFVTNTRKTVTDFGSQARTNRASRQVLSFFMLQSGMAVSELIYATVTHTSGLFSISTDNLFCSLALATGLMAIRISARTASTVYSYGYSRAESVGGFANAVMLIYVAALIVLEAQERSAMRGSSAIGRAFSVCVLGISGNALGLYFFPPETRRENHNVQGIYLHIVANTLAFTSMAVSTLTKAIAPPEWYVVDVGVVCAVACGVIGFAVPLMVRSARLLLLMVSKEKKKRLARVEERLAGIPGVCQVSGLRVWSLTPNSLVGSVKLEVNGESQNSVHSEILSNARSVFAMMGVPSSQCTVQISFAGNQETAVTTSTTTAATVDGAIYFSVGENSKGV